MTTSIRIAPQNSLVLIVGSNHADIPPTMDGSLIVATSTCIVVGCQSDVDGETEFTMGAMTDVDPASPPAFKGILNTPEGKISLRSVLGETILEVSTSSPRTHVHVWVNDASEPDKVIVGLGLD